MDNERRNASQSYYVDNDDNVKRENVPFSLNCVGEIYLSKQFRTHMPYGRNDYYLMYMEEGSLNMEISGSSTVFSAGRVICMRPNTPYSYENADLSTPIRYYWMHFTGNDCERILSECGLATNRVMELGKSHETDYYFEDMFSEFRKRRPNFDFAVSLKAQYLLLYIGRTLRGEDGGDTSPIERSIKYIHTNIKQTISVKALADMEFLSPSRYREVFRAVTGLSPIEYISRQRIHLACELIEQGDIPLSNVAELCGFSDRLYFQRAFKKRTSLTPGEYRKRIARKPTTEK